LGLHRFPEIFCMTSFEGRTADYPVEKLLLERWSPRAFTGDSIPHDVLMTIFEAARWAPSSYNSQPWRIVYGLHGTPAFEKIFGLLVPANQGWAKAAAALLVIASKTTMAPRGTEIPSHSHSFDAGAAWQNLALQAAALGWHAHGMTGFDIPRAATELGIGEGYRVEAAVALGKQGDKSVLPEAYQAMETPNGRNPVSSFVFEGAFPGK
jgi:nitroreductase